MNLPDLITDRDEYFKQKQIEHQNRLVTFKSSSTRTSEALVWTYRTTNCDVISIITTASMVKDGKMKDIRIQPQEVKRLKPPSLKLSNRDLLGSSPYDIGLSVDVVKKTKKMNQMLQDEKKEFMAKLNITRFVRSKLENDASTKIQAVYRGYYTRKNFGELRHFCEIRRMIHSNVRSFLDHRGYSSTSACQFTTERKNLRNLCATIIQCAYRRLLSRKCLRRLIRDKLLSTRSHAAVIIQAHIRGISARARVRALIEKRRIILYRLSVIKIQAAFRGMIGRRRVHRRRYRLHFLAARMIQRWYRAKYSRRIANHIKHVLHVQKTNRGARFMQCIVRRFLAARRLARIRLRRLHVQIFDWVTRMQCCVRRFLARVRVAKKRSARALQEEEQRQRQARLAAEAAQAAEQAEAKALLEGADIFLQAKLGNTVGVEDIFKGLMGGEHLPTDTDGHGDTVLTLSAQTGNTDLLRKCIQWGFDINHRNADGHNAIMLAARNNQLEAFQYLLSFHQPATALQTSSDSRPTDDLTVTIESMASGELIGSKSGSFVRTSSSLGGASVGGGSVASAQALMDEQEDADRPALILLSEDIGFLYVSAAANCALGEMTMLQAMVLHGFDVNTLSTSRMTAMHAACEIGHVDAFRLLNKFKARADVADDQGQTPLHKACSASLQIVQWILGLDPDFNTYMSEATRLASILAVDLDGKDTILHAALAGQSETVELLTSIVAQQGSAPETVLDGSSKKSAAATAPAGATNATASSSEEISWSPQDISKGLQLVQHGNLYCLHRLLESGYDADWQDDAGLSLVHAACRSGDKDMIDLLFERGANFSLVDQQGRNCFHYLSTAKDLASELFVHLLSHPGASKCQLSKSLLLAVDQEGNNPFHIAARDGTEIQIDLLASDIFPAVLNARNQQGLTPLLLACGNYRDKLIVAYLKLGADALLVDHQDHGALWHLFHPSAQVLEARRPWCSEYLTNSSNHQPGVNQARKEKDDEVLRLAHEANVVILLLKAGCTLYSDYGRTPEQMRAIPFNATAVPQAAQDPHLEPGDVAIQELSFSLFKAIIPSTVSVLDAWRLFISSLRFDDGSLRMVQHQLRMGILDVIAQDHEPTDEQSVASSAAAFSKTPDALVKDSTRGKSRISLTPMLNARAQSIMALDNYQVSRVQDVFFLDLNAVGWMIHMHCLKPFQHFVKRGYDVTAAVDARGNPCLHCIAAHGVVDMVDIAVQDKKVRYEQVNPSGYTAGMVAAKMGNFKVAKRLFELRASPRKSLEGLYASWVLAFARKFERNEKNLQCGRYGDDDEQYFSTSPDPFYATWYSG